MTAVPATDLDAVAVLSEALDMLDCLCEYARIATDPPPEHVFRFFQRLHGLPEVGAPPPQLTPRAALDRLAVLIEGKDTALRDALAWAQRGSLPELQRLVNIERIALAALASGGDG